LTFFTNTKQQMSESKTMRARGKKVTKEEWEFIHSKQHSVMELVKLGFGETTVRRILLQKQFTTVTSKRRSKEEKAILENPELTYEQVKEMTGLSDKEIVNYAERKKLHRLLSYHKEPNPINHNFFKENSYETWWVLGMLASDGSVDRNELGVPARICWDLKSKDVDVLEKIKKLVNSDCDVRTKDGVSRFSICSLQMATDVVNLGFPPAKSLILEFPKSLTPEFYKPFILGYFDGDGCVCDPRAKATKIGYRINVSFIGTKSMMRNIQKIISKFVFDGEKRGTCKHSKGNHLNTWRLCYTGDPQCLQVLDWMYSDSNDSCRMKRKYEKYVYCKQVYG
jgi:hypothetical protein